MEELFVETDCRFKKVLLWCYGTVLTSVVLWNAYVIYEIISSDQSRSIALLFFPLWVPFEFIAIAWPLTLVIGLFYFNYVRTLSWKLLAAFFSIPFVAVLVGWLCILGVGVLL